MASRTIEISRNPAHLAVSRGQLLIIPKDSGNDRSTRHGHEDANSVNEHRHAARPDLATLDTLRNRIPVEDIGLLVVDHAQTTYTHSALAALVDAGASVVICGNDHLPVGIMVPVSSHTQQVWRVADQINCPKVLRKQLWQTIVRAKIEAQSRVLPDTAPERTGLLAMARRVRSDDAGNLEAQAARIYWQALFPPKSDWRFKRSPGGGADATPPNNLLDYGYAILRAAVARALVGAGLLPVIGIQHSNRSNAFCLADDLVEPLRPLIDRRVRRLFDAGRVTLDQPTKAELLLMVTATVRIGNGESATVGPLDAALTRYAASLARSYAIGKVKLLIPVEPDSSSHSPGP
jgi:CRISPR-associated protein Cas1